MGLDDEQVVTGNDNEESTMVDRDVTRTRRVARHLTASPPPPVAEPSSSNPATATNPTPAIEASEEADKPPLGSMQIADRPYGFPTAETLAGQDAEAAELRQELEQLRQLLDDGPPALPPVRKRNRRPLLGVLVVGGTLGAIATATLIPWSSLELPGQNEASPAQTTAAPQVPAASASAGPVGPIALAPLPVPAGSLPATGPGIDSPGTTMAVKVGSDGDLRVFEQAVLGPRGLREITLSLPSMSSLGGEVADLNPTVRNLRVSVNGTPVTPTPTAGSGWRVAITGRARTVQLSYRITNAVVRTRPSSAGRALGVSLPLLGQALREQGLPLVVRALGPEVNAVSCPGAPTAEMLCGTEIANGWVADVPASASSPVVLMQLNLKP